MASALPRHQTLDVIRGAAVMGILLVNIVAFGLPESAYFSPLAWGGAAGANRIAWFLNFVFVEGRFRGLFSFLFGASMLLVIERAEASGQPAAAVHLSRMFWLFAIGWLHLYLLWWGDILTHYALVGAFAFVFHRLPTRLLVVLALLVLAVSMLIGAAGLAQLVASAPRATPTQAAIWDGFGYAFGVPPASHLAAELAALRGTFLDGVNWRWANAMSPFTFVLFGGAETLSAMLLGMAAYRSGFLTGAWTPARYRRIAIGFTLASVAGYAVLGAATIAHAFDQRWVYLGSIVASAPFRVLGFVGYAALVILAVGADRRVATRMAAVGRMAFSNYLATTLAMEFVFAGWGLGWFGHIERAALYLLVPPAWALMLLWSPPWLARFEHGPLEWVWRSLARRELAPMRHHRTTNRNAVHANASH